MLTSKVSGTGETSESTIKSTKSPPGITVAIYEVGCAFGALSSFIINDTFGRPRSIMLSSCVVIIGVIIQACTYSLGQMIVGRVITGVV